MEPGTKIRSDFVEAVEEELSLASGKLGKLDTSIDSAQRNIGKIREPHQLLPNSLKRVYTRFVSLREQDVNRGR